MLQCYAALVFIQCSVPTNTQLQRVSCWHFSFRKTYSKSHVEHLLAGLTKLMQFEVTNFASFRYLSRRSMDLTRQYHTSALIKTLLLSSWIKKMRLDFSWSAETTHKKKKTATPFLLHITTFTITFIQLTDYRNSTLLLPISLHFHI